MAGNSLEHAEEPPRGEPREALWTKRAAIIVAMFAAIAVLVEMSGNDAQTEYLAHYIAASDAWNQYQAKSVRRAIYAGLADVMQEQLAAQPASVPDDALGARIAAARANAERMRSEPGNDGMAQLAVKAQAEEQARDHDKRLHDRLERSVRGLQIAIVMMGLFIVTRLRWVLVVGITLGILGTAYALYTGGAVLLLAS